MASHLGFEWQIPTVMFVLLSHTRKRFDIDVQNCCTCANFQNRCETVSTSLLQISHRAEPTILHFVKNLLVGTIRIIATNHRVLPREAGQHESWLLYD